MSSRVTLRTLTWKSTFGFGYDNMKDLTMLQLYDLGKAYEMIKAYYVLEKINYIDEILEKLGITEDLRIEKPSNLRNDERCSEFISKAYSNYKNLYTDEERRSMVTSGKAYDKKNSIGRKVAFQMKHTSKAGNMNRNRKYK
jgi:hypothetical protein